MEKKFDWMVINNLLQQISTIISDKALSSTNFGILFSQKIFQKKTAAWKKYNLFGQLLVLLPRKPGLHM